MKNWKYRCLASVFLVLGARIIKLFLELGWNNRASIGNKKKKDFKQEKVLVVLFGRK